jgi:hypothetical protein
MNKLIYSVIIGLTAISAFGQEDNSPQNLASTLISNPAQKLNIGGYAQVDMTTQLQSGKRSNTSLDVSRMVLSVGYRFSDKTQFLAEVEFEHVKELYVEQAFLNHTFSDALSFRAGLMLIPMGIINEYHEPTTYNGVLRPSVDNLIVPTTWREIGAGFTGRFQDAGLKYQLYLVNGFSSYGSDGKGTLNGSGYLRSGRQRGAKSFLSAPNLSAKVDYYGIRGLKLGLAGYFGDTQSALFNNLDKSDEALMARADSSVVGINMVNTHLTVDTEVTKMEKYSVKEYVFGIGWKPAEGAVFKVDMRMRKSKADDGYSNYVNAGIGVWF